MRKLSKPNVGLAEGRPFAGMSQVHTHAAGVDIGAHEIMVLVQGGDTTQLVRSFGSYTVDLQAIGMWLEEHGVETVAMESTGVYWIPLFEELERRGFYCHLISSRSLRRVLGPKSDVVDCQWIQTLHSYGRPENSFRPEADLVALRTLLRHRAQLIQPCAPHILHMQKVLLQMNIQLSQALSDVSGATGQTIIRAIVCGERDPYKLAQPCRTGFPYGSGFGDAGRLCFWRLLPQAKSQARSGTGSRGHCPSHCARGSPNVDTCTAHKCR
jgi:transposase